MSRRGRNFNYEKPENINATLRRLLTYVSDKMLLIGLVLVLVMSSSVLSIYAVKLVEPIINEGIIPLIGKEITSESLAVFVRLLVILGIVSLLSALLNISQPKSWSG